VLCICLDIITPVSFLAMREYHLFNDVEAACKIYQSGVKSFGEEPAFLSRYLEFLSSVNDDQSKSLEH
jgi:cleavage stimulation factor subunit 3